METTRFMGTSVIQEAGGGVQKGLTGAHLAICDGDGDGRTAWRTAWRTRRSGVGQT